MNQKVHSSSSPPKPSHEEVLQQVEKLSASASFRESDVLKRFLAFIVAETLNDRANCLKEYTIGVAVLGKPLSFKPQENGIVRIHARRLRRALFMYYANAGANDVVGISVPKGTYVPKFSNTSADKTHQSWQDFNEEKEPNQLLINTFPSVAILPLEYVGNDFRMKSFSESLCLHLGTALLQADNKLRLIAHQAVKALLQKTNSITEIGRILEVDYFIAGGLQVSKDYVRVHLQLINAGNLQQIWGNTFKNGVTPSLFEIEDQIVVETVANISRLSMTNVQRPFTRIVEAV